MAILLVIGVMNLWAMAIVAAVITVERFARASVCVLYEPLVPLSSAPVCS